MSKLTSPFGPKTALSALAGVALFASAPAQAADQVKPNPKLVVVISIDQFSANLFEQWRGQWKGGLGKLGREGVTYPNGYQSHGMTETCPGHSSLLTGSYPNRTGIVGNNWYDATTGKKSYCLLDETVTLAAPSEQDPVSPKNLMVPTYGEWLKAVSPKSRVYGVSGKDRGAITMAGHDPDGAFWYQAGFGFTTYVKPGEDAATKLKPVAALNARLAAEQKKKPFVWTYENKACAALEKTWTTGDRTWDAKLPRPLPTNAAETLRDLSASPYTDAVTLEAAAALRDEFGLGDGPQVDVLTVSLSATDFIGHRYGTRGPEMCDHLSRLDARLDTFLSRIGKAKGEVLVVLSADHGGSDFPERLHDEGYDVSRIATSAWLKGLNQQLRTDLALDYDPLVAPGGIDTLVIVGADRKTPPATERARIASAALALVRSRGEVAEAYEINDLLTTPPVAKGTSPDTISVKERLRRSAYPGRSGDILVAFKPNLVPATASNTYVATHGTPWDYDRRVPILFWWKNAQARERILPIETVDIAPTIAAVTGVPIPKAIDGRCRPLGAGHDC
ncbi:alkaline phosphatase family protein [Caulobacter endophyticus]|uniref:alkaline phosphatase PhoY n=1 Tax=Caulobacter endophyticus TaxID=2172652 RepID=UPI00240F3595|nr:alkaline phosphatase family protein [Caulobacter endophyticus]MDG2530254.1 alkaline phosphatase family protein [Caulobacter endophyticus]